MSKTRKLIQSENGFTLVELMVTVLLTAIAVVAIYRGYTSFSQAADAQQQVMEMQQNLRIGMTRMIADIRRAGMNEEDDDIAGFIAADATSVEFSMDIGSANGPVVFATDGEDNDNDGVEDDDPDPVIAALEAIEESRVGDGDVTDDGESIRYSLESDEDVNNNGVLDAGEDLNGNNVLDQWLVREVWDNATAGYIAQTVITNVDALNFVYWDDGDPGASPAVLPARMVIGAGGLTAIQLDVVDRVEITLVVRTTNEDYRITNSETYQNLVPADIYTVNPPDNFRRRAFSMSVQIRNNI